MTNKKPTPEEAREGLKRLGEAARKASGGFRDFGDKVKLAADIFAEIIGEFEGSVVLHIQKGKVRKADVTKVHRF